MRLEDKSKSHAISQTAYTGTDGNSCHLLDGIHHEGGNTPSELLWSNNFVYFTGPKGIGERARRGEKTKGRGEESKGI